MTTILRSGIDALLGVFVADRAATYHVRELSRKTGLQGQSIVRHLATLEDDGLLVSSRVGNQRRYRLAATPAAYAVMTFFDVKRHSRLPRLRQQAVHTYLQALPKRPVFAVLFGSTAKGTAREDSDIDLLLVTNERMDVHGAERETNALHAVRITTFQLTYAAFLRECKLKEDAVVQSALSTGYPLINHVAYYEVTGERV
jgi:DNA-binding transcriptional ArsR family regulator/predicted nucleotidyltransferase